MSSPFVSKKHAVSSETGATENFANDGPSSQHKRMRLEPEDINDDDHDRKPSADPHRDLELAFQRKAKALADLEAAQHAIAKARRDIRARGEAEFDSLLVVGNDSVSHILSYFDVKKLCQCERTCKSFQRLSEEGWKGLDKRSGPNKSIVDSAKQRCVRYVRASEHAKKMERHASSHRWIEYSDICENTDVQYESLPSDNNDICDQLKNEIWPDNDDNSCESSALCGFPNELATVDKAKTELFLRICNRSGEVMMEGFFPLRTLEGGLRNGERCLDLCSAHCPNWPEMESLLSRQLSDQDKRKNMWDERVQFAIVTLIALTKFNAPRVVAAVDDFEHVEIEYDDDPTTGGGYPEDDPWYPTISAKNPMKPHYFQTEEMKVKSRGVEFGWCKNRKVIGFCLVESEHVYHDFSDFMHSP